MGRQFNIILLSLLLTSFAAAERTFADDTPVGNMVRNPQFTFDWMNNQAEGHVLAFRSDWSFNASDLKPDYWPLKGDATWTHRPDDPTNHCLQLAPGASTGQSFPMGVWHTGGGGWRGPTVHTMTHAKPTNAVRGAVLNVNIKAADGESATAKLTLKTFGVTKIIDVNASNTWRRASVTITREEILAAYNDGKAKGLPADLSFTIASAGAGRLLIDDVTCSEHTIIASTDQLTSPLTNQAVNASFEKLDETGYPDGWSQPAKYMWRPPFYYQFTDWYHSARPPQGRAKTTSLIARTGARSLHMQVLPGDETTIEGPPTHLNQQIGPEGQGVIEIGVYVLTDRVKWLDLRAVDQDGNDIPAAHAYRGRWRAPQDTDIEFPSNTGLADADWTYIRKWFQPQSPAKFIRPQLCARGFNGDDADDAGTRPNVVQTGNVFWDDLVIIERTADIDAAKRHNAAADQSTPNTPGSPPAASLSLSSLNLGQRRFGLNQGSLTFKLKNQDAKTASAVKLKITLTQPNMDAEQVLINRTFTSETLLDSTSIPFTYQINTLAGDWDAQAHLRFVTSRGEDHHTLDIPFNTWPVVVDADFSKHYALPNENPQTVALNFGVTDATLAMVDHLAIEIRTRRNDAVVQTLTINDLPAAFAQTQTDLPQEEKPDGWEYEAPGPVYWADKKNLLAIELDLANLPIHPADKPVRDHYLHIRGVDGSGNDLFADDTQPFGRVAKLEETLPKVTATSVREDGALLVNGEPTYMMAIGTYPTARYTMAPERIKQYGFNARRWVENIKTVDATFRDHNLWSLESMLRMNQLDEAALAQQTSEGKLDGALTLAPYYEHSTFYDNEDAIAQQKKYEATVNRITDRVANYGGGGAHHFYTLDKILDDFPTFGLEIEPIGPPRGGYELARILRKGHVAWFHLPQTYDTTPFEQFRFDQYETIIQGGRGYSIIQGLGDPSLYRGINGELRYLSPYIFSPNSGPEGTAAPRFIKWIQKQVDNKVVMIASHAPPMEIGQWTWRDTAPDDMNTSSAAPPSKPISLNSSIRMHASLLGKPVEGDPRIVNISPTPDGLRLHGFRQAPPIMIKAGDIIHTRVRLDADDRPTTIAFGVRGDAQWNHNAVWGQSFDFNRWNDEWIHLWLAGELTPGVGEITRWHTYLFNSPTEAADERKAIADLRASVEQLQKLIVAGRTDGLVPDDAPNADANSNTDHIAGKNAPELIKMIQTQTAAADKREAALQQKIARLEHIRQWAANHILSKPSFKFTGDLPADDRIVDIRIPAETLGLVGKQTDGLMFIARHGRAWWGPTVIERGDAVLPLVDDRLYPANDTLANVDIAFPWAADGTTVDVLFEERQLTVKRGRITDDWRTPNTYGAIGLAFAVAPKWDATGRPILARGLSYPQPAGPVAARAYEIQLKE